MGSLGGKGKKGFKSITVGKSGTLSVNSVSRVGIELLEQLRIKRSRK